MRKSLSSSLYCIVFVLSNGDDRRPLSLSSSHPSVSPSDLNPPSPLSSSRSFPEAAQILCFFWSSVLACSVSWNRERGGLVAVQVKEEMKVCFVLAILMGFFLVLFVSLDGFFVILSVELEYLPFFSDVAPLFCWSLCFRRWCWRWICTMTSRSRRLWRPCLACPVKFSNETVFCSLNFASSSCG